MKLKMLVEVEVRKDCTREECLSPSALIEGKALLLLHSNELGCVLGQVRVIDVVTANAGVTGAELAKRPR